MTTHDNGAYVKYPCAVCRRPTAHVNPVKRGSDLRGQTRYNLCRECGGVPPNAR